MTIESHRRRPVQQAHERAHITAFLDWFNARYRSNYCITKEPNPPDALLRSNRKRRWIELSTAYWRPEYARDLASLATPGEMHKPIKKGPFRDMDAEFSENFADAVKKKLEKSSYIPWREKYGPGFLLIAVEHPWFDSYTLGMMRSALAAKTINDQQCFRSIYTPMPPQEGAKFCRWSIK